MGEGTRNFVPPHDDRETLGIRLLRWAKLFVVKLVDRNERELPVEQIALHTEVEERIADAGMVVWTAMAAKADTAHVHPQGEVTGLAAALAAKAPLANPTFTGTPLAPTAPSGTATHQVATTAFVHGCLQERGLTAGHTHEFADVPGLTPALDGKAAALHPHPMIEVTGLGEALADKADVVHVHAEGQVAGLVPALDALDHLAGRVATLDGALAALKGANAPFQEIHDASETWRCPRTGWYWIELWGGGGGGGGALGGADKLWRAASGGSSGGRAAALRRYVEGAEVEMVVGGGGLGGAPDANGYHGGPTTFDGLTADGGTMGIRPTFVEGKSATAPARWAPTGGVPGGHGMMLLSSADAGGHWGIGGYGGSSPYGIGGHYASSASGATDGPAGTGRASGGAGGATGTDAGSAWGGNGTSGLAVLTFLGDV